MLNGTESFPIVINMHSFFGICHNIEVSGLQKNMNVKEILIREAYHIETV